MSDVASIGPSDQDFASPVDASPLGPRQWMKLGELSAGLASIFTTGWQIQLLWFTDGLPTIQIMVWAPQEDWTQYDDDVEALLDDESNLPPGYEFTGQSHSTEAQAGAIQRTYDLDPKERGPE